MELKRGRKTGKIELSAVKIAQEKLSKVGLTSADEMTKKSAIQAMKKQIRAARARGVAWTEIAKLLAESGVGVSVRTLKGEIEAKKETKVGVNMQKKGQMKVQPQVAQVQPVTQERRRPTIRPDHDEL